VYKFDRSTVQKWILFSW